MQSSLAFAQFFRVVVILKQRLVEGEYWKSSGQCIDLHVVGLAALKPYPVLQAVQAAGFSGQVAQFLSMQDATLQVFVSLSKTKPLKQESQRSGPFTGHCMQFEPQGKQVGDVAVLRPNPGLQAVQTPGFAGQVAQLSSVQAATLQVFVSLSKTKPLKQESQRAGPFTGHCMQFDPQGLQVPCESTV
jgi:hypothetical protein